MTIANAIVQGPWEDASPETRAHMARLLRSEGIDLMSATLDALKRGTPVFVEVDQDLVEVQRAMARFHIRLLPVLGADEVLGVLDLVDLARREDLAG